MRCLALLALTACNSIFGNRQPLESDARFFDAPADGAVACPTPGMAPQFSPILHPVIDQPCGSYVIAQDTGRGYGVCGDEMTGQAFLGSGPIDQKLEVEPSLPVPNGDVSLGSPRVSPEGTLLLISSFDLAATLTTYRSYNLIGTTWTRGPDLPLPQYGEMSVPSRGPDRRVIFYDTPAGKEFRQAADGTWSEARDVVVGLQGGARSVWLSADALRMLIWEQANTGESLYFADRKTRDEDFSIPAPIAGLPIAGNMFITEDCTRIYMTSVQTIFYALGK